MRKTMEGVGLVYAGSPFLAYLFGTQWTGETARQIPTHFDISGQPNGWGPAGVLWLLPIVAAGIYLLMTVLGSIQFRRYNLPVPVTEANLPFIQKQTSEMVAWIKCELLCLFGYLQWSIIQSARSSEFRLSPLLIPLFLLVIFSTVGWYLTAIIRGARARAESSDSVKHMGNY